MTPTELQEAFIQTIQQISQLRQQIVETTDPSEIRRLNRRLRKLHHFQLLYFDLLESGNK